MLLAPLSLLESFEASHTRIGEDDCSHDGGNPLGTIFANNPLLSKVALQNVGLKRVWSTMLGSLAHLRHVDLLSNKVGEVEPGSFDGMLRQDTSVGDARVLRMGPAPGDPNTSVWPAFSKCTVAGSTTNELNCVCGAYFVPVRNTIGNVVACEPTSCGPISLDWEAKVWAPMTAAEKNGICFNSTQFAKAGYYWYSHFHIRLKEACESLRTRARKDCDSQYFEALKISQNYYQPHCDLVLDGSDALADFDKAGLTQLYCDSSNSTADGATCNVKCPGTLAHGTLFPERTTYLSPALCVNGVWEHPNHKCGDDELPRCLASSSIANFSRLVGHDGNSGCCDPHPAPTTAAGATTLGVVQPVSHDASTIQECAQLCGGPPILAPSTPPPPPATTEPYRQVTITWGKRKRRDCKWQCKCRPQQGGCLSEGRCDKYRWNRHTKLCQLYAKPPTTSTATPTPTPTSGSPAANLAGPGPLLDPQERRAADAYVGCFIDEGEPPHAPGEWNGETARPL
jgi:hypothetical protein